MTVNGCSLKCSFSSESKDRQAGRRLAGGRVAGRAQQSATGPATVQCGLSATPLLPLPPPLSRLSSLRVRHCVCDCSEDGSQNRPTAALPLGLVYELEISVHEGVQLCLCFLGVRDLSVAGLRRPLGLPHLPSAAPRAGLA